MISAPHDMHGPNLFALFVQELSIARAAQILGESESKIRRWIRTERVPKMAVLALYWETQYGRSLIDSDHRNELSLMSLRIRILEQQLVKAKDIITGLRRFNYGTANEPLFDDLADFDHHQATAQDWRQPAAGLATQRMTAG